MTANISHQTKDASVITKNRIIAPIVLGIAIILGIIFTRPMYLTYIDSEANIMKLEGNLTELNNEYNSLLAIKNNSSSGTGNTALLKKILEKFDRANIISAVMLNDFTNVGGDGHSKIAVGSVSIGDPSRLPNGLSLSTVSVSIQGKTIDEIVDYITYLTTDSMYAFTLENISLPIDTSPTGSIPDGYGLSLSLGVYTFE